MVFITPVSRPNLCKALLYLKHANGTWLEEEQVSTILSLKNNVKQDTPQRDFLGHRSPRFTDARAIKPTPKPVTNQRSFTDVTSSPSPYSSVLQKEQSKGTSLTKKFRAGSLCIFLNQNSFHLGRRRISGSNWTIKKRNPVANLSSSDKISPPSPVVRKQRPTATGLSKRPHNSPGLPKRKKGGRKTPREIKNLLPGDKVRLTVPNTEIE